MRTSTLPNNRHVRYINQHEVQLLQKELWEEEGYLQHGLSIERGATVIDAGANIGLFALWIFEQCAGDVQVYSFEPVPAVFEALSANVKEWAPEHLHALPFGLSDKEEEVGILFHPNMTLWSSRDASMDAARNTSMQGLSREIAARLEPDAGCLTRLTPEVLRAWLLRRFFSHIGQSHEVPCTFRPLGAFLRERGITDVDLLKVDTEGNELKILQGIDADQWPGIRQVAMEVDVVEEGDLQSVVTFLEDLGFEVISRAQPIADTTFEAVGAKHQPWGVWARR